MSARHHHEAAMTLVEALQAAALAAPAVGIMLRVRIKEALTRRKGGRDGDDAK